MRLKTLIFILITATVGLSAKDYTLSFKRAHLKGYPWSFKIDSIIDAREVKEIIGTVRKGMSNQERVAYLQNPLEEDLTRIFSESAKGHSEEKLILRINHLQIYEIVSQGREQYVAEANVSFIKKTSDGYIELFQAAAYNLNIGIFPHAQNIIDAIDECLDDFERRRARGKILPVRLNSSELSQSPFGKRNYPIQKATSLKKGVYYRFYDLRDNFLDTNLVFYPNYISTKPDEHRRATIDVLTDTSLEAEIYAFSDGTHIYKRSGREYVELKREGEAFTMDRYHQDINSFMTGIIMTALVAGPIGVGFYIPIGLPRQSKAGYILDLDVAAVVPAGIYELKSITGRTVIYFDEDKDHPTTISLSLNDGEVCNMESGTFYLHFSDYKNLPFKCCISDGTQEVCKEIQPEVFQDYVYLIEYNRKGVLQLNEVLTNLNVSIYGGIENGEIPEACPTK